MIKQHKVEPQINNLQISTLFYNTFTTNNFLQIKMNKLQTLKLIYGKL